MNSSVQADLLPLKYACPPKQHRAINKNLSEVMILSRLLTMFNRYIANAAVNVGKIYTPDLLNTGHRPPRSEA